MSLLALREPKKLAELARLYGGLLDEGLGERLLVGVGAPQFASRSSHLSLLTHVRYLPAIQGSDSVVLCGSALANRINDGRRWVHPHPLWALAGILEACSPDAAKALGKKSDVSARVAPGATVHPEAVLGVDTFVEPGAVVFENVLIGDRVIVGAGSVIGRPGFGFASGPNGDMRRIPQLGGVVIGDDVQLGALCTVDSGTLVPTRIGSRTKIDAQVHIAHNVEIGSGCLVAAQAGFAGSVVIGDGVRIGGQAGFADHVHVGDGAQVAAKSGVTRDISAGSVVAGFPAEPRLRWLRKVAFFPKKAAMGHKPHGS